MKSFIKILKFVLPYRYSLITAIFFAVLFSILNGVTIYSVVPIFDTITQGEKSYKFNVSDADRQLLLKKDISLPELAKTTLIKLKIRVNSHLSRMSREKILITISLLIIPLIFLRGLFDFISRALFSYSGNRAVFNIQKELFSHLARLPYKYFHRSRSGELLSRITRDVIPLSSAVSNDIYHFFSGALLLLTNIAILAYLNWKLIILIFILAPVISLPIGALGNRVKKLTRKIQESFADLSSHLNESISGIKVIKSFSTEDFEKSKFAEVNFRIFIRDLKKRIYQNLNPAIVELLGTMVGVALFIFGGYQIINGEISSGEFIFFLLIVLNLFQPIQMIANAINGTKAGEASAARIYEILDYPLEDFNTGIDGSFSSRIQFSGVSLKYDENYALRNISMSIPKGKSIAIVGPSGSGKSTLINCIPAFYFPEKGKVLIDRDSTGELSLLWLRHHIAMVTQEVFLFNGTIVENITCGNDYTMDRVEEAARIAHAHDFISKLPQGYQTTTGERGILLSGGERQRITIARAIFNNPEILLFDEATSSLDTESEKLIQDSLAYLFKTRTSVIISHRLSTIQNADIIYVIDRGNIIDSGSHQELISRSDIYKRLFEY